MGGLMTQHVWEKSYPLGVSWAAPLPEPVPLENLLEDTTQNYPNRTAIDFYNRELTWQEIHALAARAAKGFQTLGVGPGVTVGLHLPNTPHYAVCFFGVLMAGGRIANFSPLAAPRELAFQQTDAEVRIMVTMDLQSLYPQVAELRVAGALDTMIVCSIADFLPAPAAAMFGPTAERIQRPGRELAFADLINTDGGYIRHPHGPLADEVAVLQYTGGTTGEPKGAMLTHSNFMSVLHIRSIWVGGRLNEDDKVLAVLPLFHIFGLTFILLLAVASGMEIVMHVRFDADKVLTDITNKKITIFAGVPTMFTALVNHPMIADFDLSSLRICGSGGAPLPVDVLERFRRLAGLTPQEGYGLTETAPLATLQLDGKEPRAGTVGLPAPHTLLEIVDLETGFKVLPLGTPGEICITGPQVMKGYWKKPEATAEAFRGGRFHTGDIGFIDQAGYVTLVDRKKDMILSGGYNVFPRNIEEAIYEHPSVAEVTVIGIPDAYRGQSAKAFIALKPGANAFSLDELKVLLADKLAHYEMPTEIEFRATLPKTAVGKLSKKELIAEEAAKLSSPKT
jgi:long-chain acyl-CoA synthetase